MPYPSQVDREEIVRQARALIEREGEAAFSMSALATSLGVKAPSLYRYVDGRDNLLQAVNLETLRRLFAAFDEALTDAPEEPAARLVALAHAYRAFAHANPCSYELAFTSSGVRRPDEEILLQMVLPLQEIMAGITGKPLSLAALRGLLALIHGFVMLELNEQLQRGGDLRSDFGQSVAAYLRGWQKRSREGA